MDRQKPRKRHENGKHSMDGIDFSTNGRAACNGKSKYKRHSEKKKYDMSLNSYPMNWSPQPRFHPVTQRQYSTSESSVCHYSVPLGFAFEPVSLPIYPALIQPQGNCTVPFEIDNHMNRSKSHKKHRNRRGVCEASSVVPNDSPAIFHTPKLNNGEQDYASLPPVNCDIFATKSIEPETVCKRRFSDPGIGQMSSDDCSSSRSDGTNKSSGTAELQSDDFFTLVEQINELKESNSKISKELSETKMELETFKLQSLTWKTSSEDFQPGALSDAISEIRNAVKLSEEALVSKVIQMLEKSSIECKEAQEKLEERVRAEMNEKLSKLEEQLNNSSLRQEVVDTPTPEASEPPPTSKDSDVQQIVELERENFQLRKELQEAVAKRKTAEAATEKLERLVGILRKKINGVSLESCITDDKHILARPLASSLEKNPFIIANNRQTQKSDTLPFSKARIPPFRGFLLENNPEATTALQENKENENENGEPGPANGSSGGGFTQSPTDPCATPQVTITGPVTDL